MNAHLEHAPLQDWLARLERLHPASIALGLERVGEVRARAGLTPRFPIITVGGTNGKGSTCALLEAILIAAGYKVGCYTSPHLIRYNERVRLNGIDVDDASIVSSFEAIEQARQDTALTYFEFGTLAAMQLFIDADIDVAVMEVGLGGRLDAVNVFDADCAILTSVDLDHMEWLGDTREKIGHEKAGIMRSGRPAIYAEVDMPQSVRAHAAAIGARLLHIGQDFTYSRQGQQWDFRSAQSSYLSLPCPALRGDYQFNNAAAALMALSCLSDRLPVSMQHIREGLLGATVTGRFQVLPGLPMRIFDVAHNPHAARGLAGNLAQAQTPGKTLAVFAMLNDKDIRGVIEIMQPLIDQWLIADLDLPRGTRAQQMAALVTEIQPNAAIRLFTDPAQAYVHACKSAGQTDRIVVFGSFHTVAAALAVANPPGSRNASLV